MAAHDDPATTDDDHVEAGEPLERHPEPGQLPSDTDVQAERQEEGLEAELEASEQEERRITEGDLRSSDGELIHRSDGGEIGDGAD